MTQFEGSVVPQDPATQMTVGMYDRIPEIFAGHFAGFRDTEPDIRVAHWIAGVPLGRSSVVEIGCGDGRDAAHSFVPNSESYVGYDPSEGLLNLARGRFPDADPARVRFEQGYAQTTDYPEDTDVMMAVNSILHVPGRDLPDTFERVREGLRTGGVLMAITKTEQPDNVEVYNDKFEVKNGDQVEVVEGKREFYHHSVETLTKAAEKSGFVVVRSMITPVQTKPWDWLQFAAQAA